MFFKNEINTGPEGISNKGKVDGEEDQQNGSNFTLFPFSLNRRNKTQIRKHQINPKKINIVLWGHSQRLRTINAEEKNNSVIQWGQHDYVHNLGNPLQIGNRALIIYCPYLFVNSIPLDVLFYYGDLDDDGKEERKKRW